MAMYSRPVRLLVFIAALPVGAALWALVGGLLGIYGSDAFSGVSFYSVPFGADETLTGLDIAGSIIFWWSMCGVVMDRIVGSLMREH
jgi:hypothetical protein